MNASHGLEINKFALRIIITIAIVCLAYLAITWERRQKMAQPIAVTSSQHSEFAPLATAPSATAPSAATTATAQHSADAASLLADTLDNQQFISQALALTQHKTADAARAEIALNRYFVSWQQQQPQFAALQLELAQCAAQFCVLAVNGFAALTPAQQTAAEQALRFEQALDNTVSGVSGVDGVSRIMGTAAAPQWRAVVRLAPAG